MAHQPILFKLLEKPVPIKGFAPLIPNALAQAIPATVPGNTHAYRYYRWLVSAVDSGSGIVASEIELAETPGGPNTALGQTYTFSSDLGGGDPMSNLFDGFQNTTGATDQSGVWPQWAQVDYGATSANWKTINELRVTSRADGNFAFGGNPKDFKLQGSDDASTWTDLIVETGVTFTAGQQQLSFETAPSTAITGTAASTEADDAASATGNVDISGTSAATEAADTASGSGAVATAGTGAATEANDTASISGSVAVSGTESATEAADTASASGAVAVSGTATPVEAKDSASASGAVTVVGTEAATEANDNLAASGSVSVTGAIVATEGSDTASIAGSVTVAGSAASTEANDNCSASGTVGSSGLTGTVASTEAADTAAASGTVNISGSAQSVELADAALATGTLTVIGSLSITEVPDTGSASGGVVIIGTFAANDNADTGAATGEVTAPPRQYPLAGIAQPYPGAPQTYDALPAQPYPIRSAQTYPLEGVSQDYPLRGSG